MKVCQKTAPTQGVFFTEKCNSALTFGDLMALWGQGVG